jgi:SpoVK/Ycf46/Vps4 family AAA+-type ATPase
MLGNMSNVALISGSSGTGKTMAAQSIARELGVELFQVDLAKTISKYIGETEKHLKRILDAAEQTSAVLLFDEADSLFGERTDVGDPHDRYANIDTAAIAGQLEVHKGLVILATADSEKMDQAFIRRIRHVIEFAMPSSDERLSIWVEEFKESQYCSPKESVLTSSTS